MSHAHDVEGIGGQELEQIWFLRLRCAREQYRQAAAKLRSVLGASSVAEPSHDSDLVAAASEAESSALAEYHRVLAVFTALVEKRKQF
jgi:hypothetical protein